ncbi:MAG: chloride channel protein, partial [Bdellovibrionales bacterium]|nr:chloride channel protein [Bdellovibrionales bacterium]
MIAAILHGFFASLLVSMAFAMSMAAGATRFSAIFAILITIALVLGIAIVQYFHEGEPSAVNLERYDGAADLLIHIHSPGLLDRPSRWMLRGLVTWIFSGMGYGYGAEGVASEVSQSLRMFGRTASSRWSDLRRRTDAALSLAAGLSAGFGAPFAAVLLPAELSIGGHVLTSVLASISAYVGMQFFSGIFSPLGLSTFGLHSRLSHLWGFRFHDLKEWISALFVCLVCSVGAVLAFWIIRNIRVLVDRWGKQRASIATLFAGVLLVSVVILSPQSMGSMPKFFEALVRNELSLHALIGLSLCLFLTVCAVYVGIGTMGVWWPAFLLGAAVSLCGLRGLQNVGAIHAGAIPNAVLLGAVAWTVVWFRTPITVAVLAYELSGSGSILIPALLVGWFSRYLAERLQAESWIHSALESKRFPIRSGRATSVLSTITAGDAMVRDFQSVQATVSIEECRRLVLQGRYPFVAVVDSQGRFMGLLSADQVEEGFRSQRRLQGENSESRLAELIEVKDLLSHALREKSFQT